MHLIEINPNLRVDDYYTIASLDDIRFEDRNGFDIVYGGGLSGRGFIANVDKKARTAKVWVDWESLRSA